MLLHLFKDRLIFVFAVSALLSEILLPAPRIVRAQSSCTAYNECPYLTASSGGVTVQGPIKYQFDSSVNLYLNDLDANKF